MQLPPASAPSHRRLVVTVLLVALAARLGVWLETRDALSSRILVGDAAHYDAWGRELAASSDLAGWIGDQVFYQAPLYPYLVGAVYRLSGPDPAHVRLLQAFLGALACAFVAVVTGRLIGRRAAWIAGLGCALYAPWLWFDSLLQKASPALFLTAALLVLATAKPLRPRHALGAGVVLGLLALTRENALALVVVVLPWLVARAETQRGLRAGGLALAGLALVLAPVAWRNARLGGGFVPTAFNAGVNFYLGNQAEADGRYTPLIRGREEPELERADATRLAREAAGRPLSPAEVSRYWFQRGWSRVRAAPLAWSGLLARKALLVVNDHELMDSDAYPVRRAESRLLALAAPVLRFGLLFPLALLGAWSLRSRLGRTWILPAGAAVLGASLVLFFVTARFRVGLVPFLAPLAGAGTVALLAGPDRRAFLRRAAASLPAVVIAFWPVTRRPLSLQGEAEALAWSNLANGALREDEPAQAARLARRALALDDTLPEAHFNLGLAARRSGAPDEARRHLERAFALEPAYEADARFQLGLLAASAGDEASALAQFARAAALAPDDADLRYNHGLALERAGRTAEAAREYRAALALDPSRTDAREGLHGLADD